MASVSCFFYSGTSGLVLPVTKAHYPAEFKDQSSLHYYASLLNSIEINSTFYKLPKSSTIAKWSQSVPADFRFTFKIPKTISHALALNFSIEDVTKFLQVVEHIGEKKGCLLAQFPPSLKVDKFEQMRRLLQAFRHSSKNSAWKLALEFRDSSWYIEQVYNLIEDFNANMVLHDMQGSASGWQAHINNFIYLRFHGPLPRYRGDYSEEFLKRQAHQVKKWMQEKKLVFAYFNNTMGGAFRNLQTFNKFVLS